LSRDLEWRDLPGAALAATGLVTLIHLTPPTLFQGVDWLQLHLPARQYLADALRSGRLPLWNPHVALGRPYLADIETAVFYPPNLVHLVLDPTVAYALLTVAHATLALWGMLQLGRRLRFGPGVGWLCGALFLSSQALVSRLQSGQTHYVQAIAYLPLLFLLATRLGERTSAVRVLGLAALLALQLLCGHPQIAWLTWVGLGAFVLGRAEWGRRSPRTAVPAGGRKDSGRRPPAWTALRHAARSLAALGAAVLGALALAAPTFLPFLEMVGQGNRSPHAIEWSGAKAMSAFYWSSLAVPDGGRAAFYWEYNLYTGLAVLVGGVAGLFATWREREARGLWVAGLLGALLASGSHTPAFSLLYYLVPGASVFRLHSRAALLVVFVLVLGLGLFLSRRLRPRVAVLGLALGTGVAALLIAAYRVYAPEGLTLLALGPRALWLAGALASLSGAALATRPRTRSGASAALAIVVAADVAFAIPPAKAAWNWEVRQAGEPLIYEGLRMRGLFDVRGIPPRVAIPPELARENAGSVFGWSSVAGYQAVSLARVWGYLHGVLGIPPPLEKTFPSPLIYSRGPFPYDSMNLVAGVAPGQGLVVRPEPDPRAYLATAARAVEGWESAVSLMREGHDFHRVALLETPLPLPSEPPAGARPRARIEAFAPERIAVRTEGTEPGVLVLAEPWYPGWEATVDGRRAPCAPANAWMRAVPVPAGSHEVVLRFRSRRLRAGWALSGAALLILGAWAGWEQRRRRKRGED
jgi:hypothetical protein